ncbi:MAG: hypothetical protein IKW53_07320, partial [Clostridia bacterium]|nr:hypothetical protein [Clostridia bacterium]
TAMFGDLVANVEEAVVIPETEANVFEDSVASATLVDEPKVVVEEPVIITPATAESPSTPVTYMATREEEQVEIPEFISIIKDVTGDKKYSNAAMSRSFPEEII